MRYLVEIRVTVEVEAEDEDKAWEYAYDERENLIAEAVDIETEVLGPI